MEKFIMDTIDPIIVSFYTDDWEYPLHAERMTKDCNALGLSHHIVKKSSTKDYIQNTAIKPFFIKECLAEFKQPVLWVDVDGLLLKRPNLANINSDVALCNYFNKNVLDRDWSVSIMWFNYTQNTLDLIDRWCDCVPGKTDEAAFDIAWKELKPNLTVTVLPEQYHFVRWSFRLKIPSDTIFCNQLSQFDDKLRRKNKNGQVQEND
jgi:hypothetical protein